MTYSRCPAIPGLCFCFTHNGFLTRAGYRVLAEAEQAPQIDKMGSVSALVEVEEDLFYDERHIELNELVPQLSFLEV